MIIQISRVQVRRGYHEDLPPQLASGELGWSIDQRRLFIGNGAYEEGAPVLGNTEILTTESDALSLSGLYTFKGLAAGYEVQTGASTASQITRSMQDKFDEEVSLFDFGGVGDGVTDNSDMINRAITQLYNDAINAVDPKVRRTLNIPAGRFLLSGAAMEMLPYVRVKGAGKNASYLVQANVDHPVAKSVPITSIPNSLGSGYFEISDLTLETTVSNDILFLDSVSDVYLNRVRLSGPGIPLGLEGNSTMACVMVGAPATGGSISQSNLIVFNDCEFEGRNYALYCDNKLSNVLISGGAMKNLYQGIVLGRTVTGLAAIYEIKMLGVSVTNVSREAIYTHPSANISHVVSAFNSYKNVGNGTNPKSNVLFLSGDNCYSIGDTFDRAATEAIPSVNLNGTASFATLANGQMMLGKQKTIGGKAADLVNNVGLPVSSDIVVGDKTLPTIVEYTILRGTDSRVGTIKVATVGSNTIFEDNFVESDDMEIELTPVMVDDIIELHYTRVDTHQPTEPATLLAASRTLIGE